jgi:type II secretory pathway pseudopilin PulG
VPIPKKAGMAWMQTSTRETSDGFTLIELTLILLILGVLLTFAVPSLATLGQTKLDASARSLAAMISYLHDEAALRGRIYRLSLDLDSESYTVEVQAPFAEGELAEGLSVQWDPYAKAAILPPGIEIVRVETASETHTSGGADLYFLPEDALGGATITLAETAGGGLDLEVEPVTGRVRVLQSQYAL